jgi:hypothetical protein
MRTIAWHACAPLPSSTGPEMQGAQRRKLSRSMIL